MIVSKIKDTISTLSQFPLCLCIKPHVSTLQYFLNSVAWLDCFESRDFDATSMNLGKEFPYPVSLFVFGSSVGGFVIVPG